MNHSLGASATHAVSQPLSQPTSQSTSQATTQPTTQPTTKPLTQPTIHPLSQPVSHSAVQWYSGCSVVSYHWLCKSSGDSVLFKCPNISSESTVRLHTISSANASRVSGAVTASELKFRQHQTRSATSLINPVQHNHQGLECMLQHNCLLTYPSSTANRVSRVTQTSQTLGHRHLRSACRCHHCECLQVASL